jgi:hypothetical protein
MTNHHDRPTSERLLLSPREAAQPVLGICERSLWALTYPRGPIPCVRIGRLIKYDRRDLIAFVDAQKHGGVDHA